MSEYGSYDELEDADERADRDNHDAKVAALRPRRVADERRDEYDDEDYEPRRPNRRARRAAEQENRRSALAREADGIELVGVEYDGEVYWLPTDPQDWPVKALKAFEDGKAITALSGLLVADENGKGGWKTLDGKNYRMRQLEELFNKVAAAGGFQTAGN
ncbi:hypothetical protein [Gordonia sp. MMO-8]|uniref:hypothetical protein n=1 Tax=Gordonia sp. MMO-8 TaxID=3127886 RepID=UPI003017602A